MVEQGVEASWVVSSSLTLGKFMKNGTYPNIPLKKRKNGGAGIGRQVMFRP